MKITREQLDNNNLFMKFPLLVAKLLTLQLKKI